MLNIQRFRLICLLLLSLCHFLGVVGDEPLPAYPLHVAAFRGDLAGVDQLLRQGVDPRVLDNGRCSAIDRAIEKGHVAILELFISRTPQYVTPLDKLPLEANEDRGFMLSSLGAPNKPAMLRLLILHSVRGRPYEHFFVEDKVDGYTPLHRAARDGDLTLLAVALRVLPISFIDIPCRGRLFTPLHIAVLAKKVDVVKLLLSQNALGLSYADPFACDAEGVRVMTYAEWDTGEIGRCFEHFHFASCF